MIKQENRRRRTAPMRVAVTSLLVASGIGAQRITTAGYGDERPIASNDSEEGKAKNRRLELVVERG